jgi:hypothetical protein
MHLLIWGLALALLALWSLFGWATHAVLTVDAATLADADAWITQVAAQLPGAALLDAWWPQWRDVLRLTLDGTQALLGGLAGIAPWLVGIVWAVGAVVLLGAAAVASLLWRWLRPRGPVPPASGTPA